MKDCGTKCCQRKSNGYDHDNEDKLFDAEANRFARKFKKFLKFWKIKSQTRKDLKHVKKSFWKEKEKTSMKEDTFEVEYFSQGHYAHDC